MKKYPFSGLRQACRAGLRLALAEAGFWKFRADLGIILGSEQVKIRELLISSYRFFFKLQFLPLLIRGQNNDPSSNWKNSLLHLVNDENQHLRPPKPKSLLISCSWVPRGEEASSSRGPHCPHIGSSITSPQRVALLVPILQIILGQYCALPQAYSCFSCPTGVSM